MSATPTEITTESTIAAATGVRQHVIAVREAVSAKMDELVSYEDDLTIHRIALQILAARPDANALTLVSDDEHNTVVRVSEIAGLDEDEDPLYEQLIDIADEDLFVHASLAHRAARTESGTVTGHGYTVTSDTDEQALTGTVDLAAAAAAPKPPTLLTSTALVNFLV
jgi:hypothetical protein